MVNNLRFVLVSFGLGSAETEIILELCIPSDASTIALNQLQHGKTTSNSLKYIIQSHFGSFVFFQFHLKRILFICFKAALKYRWQIIQFGKQFATDNCWWDRLGVQERDLVRE